MAAIFLALHFLLICNIFFFCVSLPLNLLVTHAKSSLTLLKTFLEYAGQHHHSWQSLLPTASRDATENHNIDIHIMFCPKFWADHYLLHLHAPPIWRLMKIVGCHGSSSQTGQIIFVSIDHNWFLGEIAETLFKSAHSPSQFIQFFRDGPLLWMERFITPSSATMCFTWKHHQSSTKHTKTSPSKTNYIFNAVVYWVVIGEN